MYLAHREERLDQVVLIRRTREDKPMLRVVNARRLLEGGEESDVPLQRFDVIFVPRSTLAEINLWLNQLVYNNLAFSSNFSYTVNRDVRPPL